MSIVDNPLLNVLAVPRTVLLAPKPGRLGEPDRRGAEPSVSTPNQSTFYRRTSRSGMEFEEDDAVVLHDKHSEFDGEEGTITQVVETMFGDATYTVSFDDGQEVGIAADQLDPAEAADDDEE
mgnify:FL=1